MQSLHLVSIGSVNPAIYNVMSLSIRTAATGEFPDPCAIPEDRLVKVKSYQKVSNWKSKLEELV